MPGGKSNSGSGGATTEEPAPSVSTARSSRYTRILDESASVRSGQGRVNETIMPQKELAAIVKQINRITVRAEEVIAQTRRIGEERDRIMQPIRDQARDATQMLNNVMRRCEGQSMVNEGVAQGLMRMNIQTEQKLRTLVTNARRDRAMIKQLSNMLGCEEEDVIAQVGEKQETIESLATAFNCEHDQIMEECDRVVAELEDYRHSEQIDQLQESSLNSSLDHLLDEEGNGNRSVVGERDNFYEEAQQELEMEEKEEEGRSNVNEDMLQILPRRPSCLDHQRPSPQAKQPSPRRSSRARTVSQGTIDDYITDTMRRRPHSPAHDTISMVQGHNTSQGRESDGMTQALVQLLKSQAVPKLEQFSGEKGENWGEYVESFLLRYPKNSWDNSQLKGLLKDLLTGNAKAHYSTLAEHERNGSFDNLVAAMRNRLRGAEKVSRLRAIEQWRSLRMRPGQSVAKFCLELEKWSARAEPDRSGESMSFIRAEMLYKQVAEWDGSFHLAQLLETTDDKTTYDRMKEMTLTLERTRQIAKTNNVGKKTYEEKPEAATKPRNKGVDLEGKSVCFHCGKPGHMKKDCRKLLREMGNGWKPEYGQGRQEQQRGNVNGNQGFQTGTQPMQQQNRPFIPNNQLQQQNRPVGSNGQQQQPQLRSFATRVVEEFRRCNQISEVTKGEETKGEAYGDKPVVEVEILGETYKALVDTGSQLSILSAEVIEQAMTRGVDVHTLVKEVSPTFHGKVFDASGGEMKFVALAEIKVKVKENERVKPVIWHLDKNREGFMILGTNALEELGIRLVMDKDKGKPMKVAEVAERVVVSAGQTKKVRLTTTGTGESTGILWSRDERIPSGVFNIAVEGLVEVQVANNSKEAMVFRKGETMGEWGNEPFTNIPFETTWEMLDDQQGRPELGEAERDGKLLEILGNNRTEKQGQQKLVDLIKEFRDIFTINDTELTRTEVVQHDIDTGNNSPIKQKTRPVPIGARVKFKEMIDDLLKRDLIERSKSAWASPIVLVEKKDKSLRLCIDYRELNKVIKQDSYPLPAIDKVLQTLGGKSFFSTLDMCAGYWQIPLTEEAKEKSAFTTSEGLFQFKVLPFGLSTSPATFQRLMDSVLENVRGDEVHVYIDDIMIATDTEERHFEVLREVFLALRKAHLCLKSQKCKLLERCVPFLGHVVDEKGVHVDPGKVLAIKEYPQPNTVSELRTFLGMASYYRKFVLKFAALAKPLHELTSTKVPWEWDSRRKDSFEKLKSTLCEAPILAQPDVEKARTGERPFILYTDASGAGVGAVLCQEGKDKLIHPICFTSKGLSKAERNYHVTDLEALAVVHAVHKFHYFVYGMRVIVRTDHQPLTCLFARTSISGRIMRWALELQRYDLKIEYIKGSANAVADALSRGIPTTGEEEHSTCPENERVVGEITVAEQGNWLKKLRNDDDYKEVLGKLDAGVTTGKIDLPRCTNKLWVANFRTTETDLELASETGEYKKIVPKEERRQLFDQTHAGLWAGHFGAKKVLNKLKKDFFWNGMGQDVHKWHTECQKCFINNAHVGNTPPLKPIVTTMPYELVGIDIMEMGLTSRGNKYILTVVDHFSKWAGAYAIPNKSAETVAEMLTTRWICEGGRWPRQLHSDQGTEFINKICDRLCTTTKIDWSYTKGYNPRENGITERLNATIAASLRKSGVTPCEWDALLPFVVFAYNNTVHDSTGESPFFLLHGFDQKVPGENLPQQELTLHIVDREEYQAALIEGMRLIRTIAKEKNDKEREKAKEYYDNKNSTETRKYPGVGDRVYMKMPTTKGKSTHPKLINDFTGPFRVIETSENSALITGIDEKQEPIRINFDLLLGVPPTIDNTPLTTKQKRKRVRNKKNDQEKAEQEVNSISFRSEKVQLLKQDPYHPQFVCKNEKVMGPMGLEYQPDCPIQNKTMADALGQVPLSVERMPAKGFMLLAHVASVMKDISIEPEDKESRILDQDRPHYTSRGVCIAISFFKKNCVHCIRKSVQWNNEDKKPYYTEEPGFPSLDIFENAWRLVLLNQMPVDGNRTDFSDKSPVIFVPFNTFRHMKDRMEFVGANVVFYDKLLEGVYGPLNTESHRYAIVVGPPKIPIIHVRGSLNRMNDALQVQQIQASLVPPPWSRKYDGNIFQVFYEEGAGLEQRTRRVGQPILLKSYYPSDSHVHSVSDVWTVLGVDPRERGQDPFSLHQIAVYFEHLAILLKNSSTPLPKFNILPSFKSAAVGATTNTVPPTNSPFLQLNTSQPAAAPSSSTAASSSSSYSRANSRHSSNSSRQNSRERKRGRPEDRKVESYKRIYPR